MGKPSLSISRPTSGGDIYLRLIFEGLMPFVMLGCSQTGANGETAKPVMAILVAIIRENILGHVSLRHDFRAGTHELVKTLAPLGRLS